MYTVYEMHVQSASDYLTMDYTVFLLSMCDHYLFYKITHFLPQLCSINEKVLWLCKDQS
jgi:hypothetical protein